MEQVVKNPSFDSYIFTQYNEYWYWLGNAWSQGINNQAIDLFSAQQHIDVRQGNNIMSVYKTLFIDIIVETSINIICPLLSIWYAALHILLHIR